MMKLGKTTLLASLLATLLASLAGGCASTEAAKVAARPAPSTPKTEQVAQKAEEFLAPNPGGKVAIVDLAAPSSPIYFGFDSDQLTPQGQTVLQQMAEYLRSHPQSMLTVEGHCDETGSAEYNLSLGERRARAARAYLKALGVAESRLKTISYGEEKPAVAGSDDEAHQKNRRGAFELTPG